MHGATHGQGMRMSQLATTSTLPPSQRISGANMHIATPSALPVRRTPLQQQAAHQPIVAHAAKTTQAEIKDAAPKKKRAPRKKKDPSAEGDAAPKQRKAARPIKRTDADAAFLQLLPEDTLEQLQVQLQDEMEALVERKGGGMLTKNKKKAAPADPVEAEDAPEAPLSVTETPPVEAECV